jgi:hypothetical protein
MGALYAVDQAVAARQMTRDINDVGRENVLAVSQLIPTKKLLNRQAPRKGPWRLAEAPELVQNQTCNAVIGYRSLI